VHGGCEPSLFSAPKGVHLVLRGVSGKSNKTVVTFATAETYRNRLENRDICMEEDDFGPVIVKRSIAGSES
jgi:hypothetical protein